MKRFIFSVCFAIAAVVSVDARAESMTVINHSFESPVVADYSTTIDNWSQLGSGGSGVLDISQYPEGTVMPDGSQSAWLNFNTLIFQSVGAIEADRAYTMKIWQQRFAGITVSMALKAGSYDNAESLASLDLVPEAELTWAESTLAFDTFGGNNADAVGSALVVVLASPLQSGQGHGQARYDDVRITVSEIPEPSAFVLLGAGLLGLLAYAWRRRK